MSARKYIDYNVLDMIDANKVLEKHLSQNQVLCLYIETQEEQLSAQGNLYRVSSLRYGGRY